MSADVRVSIGVPVYNGENFLAEALESILAQTFTDLEIIISDNASTDKTQEICQAYAAKDSRIRYYRNEKNLGAAPNFNRLVGMARGEYFKWAAHDDLLAPEFVECCVEVLDQDPSVVLCFSRVKMINMKREEFGQYQMDMEADSPSCSRRFAGLVLMSHPCYQVFGLIRLDALKKTPLIGPYTHGDRVLLGQLGLLGRQHEVPEFLFYHRRHQEQFISSFDSWAFAYDASAWFDTSARRGPRLPFWRTLREYVWFIIRIRLPLTEYPGIALTMVRWTRINTRWLFSDLRVAATETAKVVLPQPVVQYIKHWKKKMREQRA